MKIFLICLFKKWKKSTAQDWKNWGDCCVMVSSSISTIELAHQLDPFFATLTALIGFTAKFFQLLCSLAVILKNKRNREK